MNGQSLVAWDYIKICEGIFFITAPCDDPKEFTEIAIAEVFSGHAKNPEFNARLIAASPVMRIALSRRYNRWNRIVMKLAEFEGLVNNYDSASPDEVRALREIHRKLYECQKTAKYYEEELRPYEYQNEILR